jgi:hypothetical protein
MVTLGKAGTRMVHEEMGLGTLRAFRSFVFVRVRFALTAPHAASGVEEKRMEWIDTAPHAAAAVEAIK